MHSGWRNFLNWRVGTGEGGVVEEREVAVVGEEDEDGDEGEEGEGKGDLIPIGRKCFPPPRFYWKKVDALFFVEEDEKER